MRGPWHITPAENMEVVAPGGEIRGVVRAHFGGTVIVIPDPTADVRTDDEMRRRLPNGNDEVFVVTETTFYNALGMPPHYQVQFRRAGHQPHHKGGNFTINITGASARVNINSTDNSINTLSGDED